MTAPLSAEDAIGRESKALRALEENRLIAQTYDAWIISYLDEKVLR